jgi:hypothetical protein
MFLGSKAGPARNTDSLTAICEPIVKKIWDRRRPVREITLFFIIFSVQHFNMRLVTAVLIFSCYEEII